MNTEEIVIEKLKTFSPETQQEVLRFMEFLEFRDRPQVKSKSDVSALEASGTLVGCLKASPDLSTNSEKSKSSSLG
jgi:Protein of unknown function (DUF2281)